MCIRDSSNINTNKLFNQVSKSVLSFPFTIRFVSNLIYSSLYSQYSLDPYLDKLNGEKFVNSSYFIHILSIHSPQISKSINFLINNSHQDMIVNSDFKKINLRDKYIELYLNPDSHLVIDSIYNLKYYSSNY